MKNVRCYDNGGETIDRYTAVYLDQPIHGKLSVFEARAMNESPFHPQGFGQMTSAMLGSHLGKKIAFKSLPPDCQKLVIRDRETNPE